MFTVTLFLVMPINKDSLEQNLMIVSAHRQRNQAGAVGAIAPTYIRHRGITLTKAHSHVSDTASPLYWISYSQIDR